MLRVELSCPSSIGTVPLIKLLSMYLRGVGRAHDTRHGQRQAAWGESSVASICMPNRSPQPAGSPARTQLRPRPRSPPAQAFRTRQSGKDAEMPATYDSTPTYLSPCSPGACFTRACPSCLFCPLSPFSRC